MIASVPCAFYNLKISGEKGNPINKINFPEDWFILKDESGGRARVFPNGAEIRILEAGQNLNHFREKFETLSLHNVDETHPGLSRTLKENQHNLDVLNLELPGNRLSQVMFQEWWLLPDENIYVMGYADSNSNAVDSNLQPDRDIKMVFEDKTNHPFIISNLKEKDLTNAYRGEMVSTFFTVFILIAIIIAMIVDMAF